MWGVYPEAMDWNVGAMHSEINLGECIWRSCPQKANIKVYSDTLYTPENVPVEFFLNFGLKQVLYKCK